jgi:hypothetical protein
MSDWMIKKDSFNTFWIYKDKQAFKAIPPNHELHDFFNAWMRFLFDKSENWEEQTTQKAMEGTK